MQPIKIVSWLTSGVLLLVGGVLPAMWAGMFVHAVRAWHFLGFWPSYDHPDPNTLPPWLLADSVERIATAGVFVIFAFGGALVLRNIGTPGKQVLGGAVICAAALLLTFIVLRADPGGVFEWYVD